MTFGIEDNIDIFPNNLLDNRVCQGFNGCNILTNDISKLHDMICYMDTPADNPSTIENFIEAKRNISSGSNVYLIPIPCTEYFFIKAFIGYTTVESVTAINFLDYRKITRSMYGRKILTSRYEKFCKSIINTNKSCFRHGDFKDIDCLCNRSDNSCEELTVRSKRYRYANMFPIAIMPTDIVSNIELIVESAYSLYNTMASNFYRAGIIQEVLPIR